MVGQKEKDNTDMNDEQYRDDDILSVFTLAAIFIWVLIKNFPI